MRALGRSRRPMRKPTRTPHRARRTIASREGGTSAGPRCGCPQEGQGGRVARRQARAAGESVGTKGHCRRRQLWPKPESVPACPVYPTQQLPWHDLQNAGSPQKPTHGHSALSPDARACCHHEQMGISTNFHHLTKVPLIRCSTAGRFFSAKSEDGTTVPTGLAQNRPEARAIPHPSPSHFFGYNN